MNFLRVGFAGNPNLCGTPLVIKCQDEDENKRRSDVEDNIDGGYVDQWFYLSIGICYRHFSSIFCVSNEEILV